MDTNQESYITEIQVYCQNRTGLLVDISSILSERKIDVIGINSRISKQQIATITISFEVQNSEALNELIKKIRQVQSVIDIKRN